MAFSFAASLPGWELVIFFALVFFFLCIGGTTVGIIISRLRWPIHVSIFEDDPIRGVSNFAGRDKARLVKFGKGGEEIYYLRTRKKYKVGYGYKLAPNRIAFTIGKDGYWYNCYIGGLDKKLRELGIVPPNRDMRLSQAAMQKGIENRYDERTTWEKIAVPLTIGMLILAIVVQAGGTWFSYHERNKGLGTELEISKQQTASTQALTDFTVKLNNIQNGGGSGLRPAT